MKWMIPLVVLVPAILAGCGSSEENEKTAPSTLLNPTGSEANLPTNVQGTGAQQKAAGEAASRNMDEAAKQEAAAKAASGGR